MIPTGAPRDAARGMNSGGTVGLMRFTSGSRSVRPAMVCIWRDMSYPPA